VKFGWDPIGRAELKTDLEHFSAAREGLGKDSLLMVDVGQIFGEDVEAAAARLPMLEQIGAVRLEEPFHTGALAAYASLCRASKIRHCLDKLRILSIKQTDQVVPVNSYSLFFHTFFETGRTEALVYFHIVQKPSCRFQARWPSCPRIRARRSPSLLWRQGRAAQRSTSLVE
jgi:hypothetical protein